MDAYIFKCMCVFYKLTIQKEPVSCGKNSTETYSMELLQTFYFRQDAMYGAVHALI